MLIGILNKFKSSPFFEPSIVKIEKNDEYPEIDSLMLKDDILHKWKKEIIKIE